jgi:hypothetical protein
MSVITFELEPSFDSTNESHPILVIPLAVGLDFALDMLPYPTARNSVLSRDVFRDAVAKFGEAARIERGLRLSDLRIVGQPIPDLIVTPSLAPSRLNVDGFLGLDFFSQFDLVEWQPKTSWMRLTAN